MASRASSRLAPLARNLRPRISSPASLQARLLQPSARTSFAPLQRLPPARLAHSIPRPTPNPANYTPSEDPETESSRPAARGPAYYQLSFTCVPCGHRSHHNISKQGYHTGSTLITCPSCRNRHIISDHLKIFGDKKQTIEDIMKEKGQLVKRGSLGEDGDIEFWPDDQGETPGSS
ncbi:DNL zinc finger domain-containing protein [Sarocladium implicatum]|nr:DNL zinc finger domain-containing protein [Sarocladium implicatum]